MDAAADFRELRDTLTEMRRAAVRQAIRPDAPAEKIAATVAGLQSSIESVDRVLADETSLAAASARPRNGHRGVSGLSLRP